ncbi:3-oxoacyl-ACP reductase FabG [Candidatus Sumerlaeota bacterium]|nr:3-oxoacyl-ACP reductase FabG [Candidatus Sumerlaeota bacterium]
MDKVLSGQVALITGGTRGIGRAIAARLASAGATVTLTGRSAESAAQAAAELAQETGGQVEGVACDSSQSESCSALVKGIVEKYGRLDILVNNAGITQDKLMLRMSDEDWHSVFNTNLHGAFYLARAATKVMMKQRGGRIINISSIVGITGNAGQANYAATKAGLIGFSKSLAKEMGSRAITVNVIAPGYIETAMSDAISDKVKEQLQANIPLGRLGKPEDIAEAVLFLASTSASYITGAVLQVDGGLAM